MRNTASGDCQSYDTRTTTTTTDVCDEWECDSGYHSQGSQCVKDVETARGY